MSTRTGKQRRRFLQTGTKPAGFPIDWSIPRRNWNSDQLDLVEAWALTQLPNGIKAAEAVQEPESSQEKDSADDDEEEDEPVRIDSSANQSTPGGFPQFRNSGTSCFLHAVLQLLFAQPDFVAVFTALQ